LHQGIGHSEVIELGNITGGPVAIVVLEKVHAPRRIGIGIKVLVAVAARSSATGCQTVVGIYSQFEPLGMYVISESLDSVWKLHRVCHDHAITVAHYLPAIIYVYELVTGSFHAVGGHRIGDAANHRVADITPKMIPAIPAHGRGKGKTIG
jgi:hypothetical protein